MDKQNNNTQQEPRPIDQFFQDPQTKFDFLIEEEIQYMQELYQLYYSSENNSSVEFQKKYNSRLVELVRVQNLLRCARRELEDSKTLISPPASPLLEPLDV